MAFALLGISLTLSHGAEAGAERRRGDPHMGEVSLTFDDGPSDPYTSQILEVLRREETRATFFFLGRNVDRHPSLAAAVAAAGHEVGSHLYSHRNPLRMSASEAGLELTMTETALRKAAGRSPVLVRFPYGDASPEAVRECEVRGYAVIKWSVVSDDWARPGAQTIIENVLSAVGNGDIVLFHDGGGDRRQTVEALAEIIPRLKERGYRMVTVSDILRMKSREDTRAAAAALGTPRGISRGGKRGSPR